MDASNDNAVDLDHAYEEDDLCENLLAYNIPVASNPFKLLDNEKVYKSENNNLSDSKDINSNSEASKDGIEENKDAKLLEHTKRYMSPEQEKAFLIEFEKLLKAPLSDISMKGPT